MKKTVVSVATLTALTGTVAVSANADEVTVNSGDTLWGLANEVGVTVDALKKDNDLNSDLINPGDVLTYNEDTEKEDTSKDNNEATEKSGTYTVKAGDTLWGIGEQFAVSSDQLMELNNLKSDMIFPGQTLQVSGEPTQEAAQPAEETTQAPEVEEVEEIEDTESAEKETVEVEEDNDADNSDSEAEVTPEVEEVEDTESTEETSANDVSEEPAVESVEVVDLKQSEQEAEQEQQAQAEQEVAEEEERQAVRDAQEASAEQDERQQNYQEAPKQQTQQASSPASSSYGQNYYWDGDCTWYVFEARKSMGLPVSNQWGNANDWADGASADGYSISNKPKVGSIAQSYAGTNGATGYGHVAIVESINGDGSITVSEMNWEGVGIKSYRNISSAQVSNHNFIH